MKKKGLPRRISVLLLCLALLIPYFPLNAFAAKLDNFDTGSDFSGVKLSVIGDSISTFYGVTNNATYNPLYLSTSEATFGTYYGNTAHGSYAEFSSVQRSDTWWQQTVDTLGMDLLVNNAWSGSFTFVDKAQGNTTEYPAAGYKNRAVNLHKGSTKPDIICVYLGTNDVSYYASQNVGSKSDIDTAAERNALYTSVNQYATPSSAIQAYYIMISRILATYPNAEVYCLLPTIYKDDMAAARKTALNTFNAGVSYIVDHYAGNGKNIYLVDLPKHSGLVDNTTVRNYYYCNNVHPSCAGMDFITSCVVSEILEHSKKGKQTADTCSVTYQLDNSFSATGLPRQTVVGKPFQLSFLPYQGFQDVRLSVTMKDANGNDVKILNDGISGNSVSIPKVTGEITITTTAVSEHSYFWKAVADDFAAIPGNGYTYNKTALVSGTYTAGDDGGTMTSAQYSLNKPVALQHDIPWVLEWKSRSDGSMMLMSKENESGTSGNTYIYINQSDVFFGYRDGVGYNNSGIPWTTIASKLGSSAGANIRKEMLEFKVVNVPNGSNNKLWLYVNGVKIGTMDASKKIGTSATHESVSAINISGKDFIFNYLGTTGHSLNNCTISYIRAYETGSLNAQTTFHNYRWEPISNKLVSVQNDNFTLNTPTKVNGSISGTTFTSATFTLDQDIVLVHDRPWTIEWASTGDWVGDRNGSMLMCTVLDTNANSAHYIYRQGGSRLIAIGEWTNGIHNNYGISLSDHGIDGTVYHKYALKNEPVFKNGSWQSNMVYLYVDDVKIGAMNNCFPSGRPNGTTSDWLNGRDLVFGTVGNASFTLGGCDLDYLQITYSCIHTFGSWTVTTAPTCNATGIETRTCSQCGEQQTRILDQLSSHSYETVTNDATCTVDGAITDTCVICGDVQVQVIPATGHSYEAVVTAPDCTEAGYTTYTCHCGDSYIADEVAALGHSYETVTVDATCTVDGSITNTCHCGDTQVEVIPATGHSFVSGICGACGEADPDYVPPIVQPSLKLNAPALEFKDMIKVIAFFTAENLDSVVEMGMITYTENVEVVDITTAAHVIPGAEYDAGTGRYYSSSQGIHAKYLGDDVYLAIYAKLSDGSYVYTRLVSYSPITYASNQLKNSTDMNLKQLVAAMLNYGAAAQNYFGYKTDALANATMTEEQIALPEAYRADMVNTVASPSKDKQGIFANNKGFGTRRPAVSFEGAFSINYFFTPNYTPVDGITMYYWTEAAFNAVDVLTVENASGSVQMSGEGVGQYRGDIEGIAAKSLSEAVYVAAVYSDGTTSWTSGVLGYSIGAYCSSQATKGGTMADLAMATAVYGYHAKAFFG